MRTRFARAVIACSLCIAAAAPLAARAAAPRLTPVVSTLADTAGGYLLLIGSDHQGSYVTSGKNVISEIQGAAGSGNDWYLSTQASRPTRAIYLDFSQQAYIGFGAGAAPFLSGQVPANPILKCSDEGVDLFGIPLNGTALCHMVIHFDYAGTSYRVGMNSHSQYVPAGWPQGDMVRVTCTAVSAGKCTRWHLDPSGTSVVGGDPNAKNVGILFLQNTNQIVGYYYFSFAMDFTK